MNGKRNILAHFYRFSRFGGVRAGLLLLLVLLTVANAMAQKPILHLETDQCDTTELAIVDVPGDRYTWDIYRDSTVNFATDKGDVDPVPYFENGMYEGSSVRVLGLEPGRYFIRVMVWDEVGCTNNLLVYMLDILETLPEATVLDTSMCIGEPTFMRIILTGRGPWEVTYTEGTYTKTINLQGEPGDEFVVPIDPLPVGTNEIWIMEVTDQCTVNSYPSEKGRVVIFPKPRNSRIYLQE